MSLAATAPPNTQTPEPTGVGSGVDGGVGSLMSGAKPGGLASGLGVSVGFNSPTPMPGCAGRFRATFAGSVGESALAGVTTSVEAASTAATPPKATRISAHDTIVRGPPAPICNQSSALAP